MGKGVADKADRRRDDEQDHEGQADDVGGEQHDGQHGDDPAEEHDEDPAAGQRAEDELAEHDRGLAGSTPWPRTVSESESAVEMARPARLRLAFTATAATTMRGRTSLMRCGSGWSRAHDDRPADEHEQDQEGVRDARRHLPQLADPALGGDVRGCASRVLPITVKIGFEASVTTVLEPAVDRGLDVAGDVEQPRRGRAAAAHRPAAAGAGVGGAVVPPGPTWMPGGPSPKELDDEPELFEGVVVAVALDWEAVERAVSAAVRTTAGEWTLVRGRACASAL